MRAKRLTHLDESGRASMVDVSGKQTSHRTAIARGAVTFGPEAFRLLRKGSLAKGDAISGWGPDSASFLVWDRNKIPADVDRIDIATGRRTRVVTLQPPDPVGIAGLPTLQMTPDGTAYTYNVVRRLSELYLVDGLK